MRRGRVRRGGSSKDISDTNEIELLNKEDKFSATLHKKEVDSLAMDIEASIYRV